MFYVYILKSEKDKSIYIGSTKDLEKRLSDHNTGRMKYTKSHIPFKLVYYEAYLLEKEARHREQNLKLKANAFNQLKRRISESLKS